MSRVSSAGDDLEEGGDLGLGRGLKPGGLSVNDEPETQFTTLVKTPQSQTPVSSSAETNPKEDSKGKTQIELHSPKVTSMTKFKLRNIGRSKTVGHMLSNEEQHEQDPYMPMLVYAEVPLGTSIGQQRQLFEHQLHQIIKEQLPEQDKAEGNNPMIIGKKINIRAPNP